MRYPTWFLLFCSASAFSALFGADPRGEVLYLKHHQALHEELEKSPEEREKGLWERKHLLLDWGGVRKRLHKMGISPTLSYVNDPLGNPIGGVSRGFTNSGSLGLGLLFDLEKILGICHMHLYTSLVYRSGTSLSARRIGNQFPVQQVFGGETFLLNQLFIQQELFCKRLTWKIGRLNGGQDFLTSPLYYYWVSNAFDGNPISIFFNTPFTAYPNATWGAYLGLRPTPSIEAKFAVYNGNLFIQQNRFHGANFTFSSPEGAFLITEWGYHIGHPDGKILPGRYRIGALYTTGTMMRFPRGQIKGNYGYYFLLEQMICRFRPMKDSPPDTGITPFVTLLFFPSDRNQFPFFTASGITAKGFFSSRPHDKASLGFVYGAYSSCLRQAQIRQDPRFQTAQYARGVPQTYEAVVEANYWFQITPWFVLVPDVQYIFRPDGTGKIPNALAVGFQVGVTL